MASSMESPDSRILEPPRGAAIAGVAFSILIVSLGVVRYIVPSDLSASSTWLAEPGRRKAIQLALDLAPFAGIAFLWFMGVLRYRLGKLEDQFFATVFMGSGLLFVASLFATAAVMSALVQSVAADNITRSSYYLGHRLSDALFNLFAMKMAAVFMFSTCTIGWRAAIIPRWAVFTGYACGLLLLVVMANWKWITLVFPTWMLITSGWILSSEVGFGQTPAVERPAV